MLSPGQGLLRVEALALWHLVGHPPQDTHLDKTKSTFCAKFMIMNVPCKFETTAVSAHMFISKPDQRNGSRTGSGSCPVVVSQKPDQRNGLGNG